MFTLDSRIDEVLNNPIGNDLLLTILEQLKLPEVTVNNVIVGSITLRMLMALSGGVITEPFLEGLCEILNHEEAAFVDLESEEDTPAWWKEAVAYQIYPRSFKDSNSDGIGDLNGIIEKLDYLKDLGINLLWLCPIYDSPNDDNGYDIRDYYKIMEEFGSMEDFDRLLALAHKKRIRIIMDLVINHTSDEHQWFQEAKKSKDNPYRDYYIWREGRQLPNNWTSFFSGDAWNYHEETDSMALHLFSKKQMDLNWEHEPLRKDLHKMINYWLDKGIDGFRLDVINFISKRDGLPDGTNLVYDLIGQMGIEHYFWGPRLHEYLREMNRETFSKYDTVTVGEAPGVGLHMCELLTHESRNELNLIFTFEHLEMPGRKRTEDYIFDLNYIKQIFYKWQSKLMRGCWYSLFYDNHDNPRMLSKIDPDGTYREPLAKLLAMIQMTLKGTPFIYQGQELGLTNGVFSSVDDFRDVESINLYNELKEKEMSEEDIIKLLVPASRDHARIVMPWNREEYGGFSDVKPWIDAPRIQSSINAYDEIHDPDSVFHFFRRLIRLRKRHKTLVYGDVDFIDIRERDYFAYYRRGEETFFIEMNLSKTHRYAKGNQLNIILCNYRKPSAFLKPYECRLYSI